MGAGSSLVEGSRNGAGLLLDHAHATPTGSGAAVRGTSTLVGTAIGMGDCENVGTCGSDGCGGAASNSGGVARGGEGVGAFSSVNVTVRDGEPAAIDERQPIGAVSPLSEATGSVN